MKWRILTDLLLLSFSIAVMFLFAGAGYARPLVRADAIAEALAPRIGADEDVLRGHLVGILKSGTLSWIRIYCIPWAILSLLLVTKVIVDLLTLLPKKRVRGKKGEG